ncbi:MAG: GCN5-related N-acetyltransferase [Bacteroidetes bacterium]|jgi:predicted GNAT family acetyltransferase|nr:GCN5-related N-acetyltransferase [Bacteroidota bacterium]
MEVKQNGNEKNGVFYIEENGVQIAAMTYVFAGETKFIIDHTRVNEGNEGRGIGKLLVKAAVDFARARQLKILPLCPFAKAVFGKTPEYNDVLFS